MVCETKTANNINDTVINLVEYRTSMSMMITILSSLWSFFNAMFPVKTFLHNSLYANIVPYNYQHT